MPIIGAVDSRSTHGSSPLITIVAPSNRPDPQAVERLHLQMTMSCRDGDWGRIFNLWQETLDDEFHSLSQEAFAFPERHHFLTLSVISLSFSASVFLNGLELSRDLQKLLNDVIAGLEPFLGEQTKDPYARAAIAEYELAKAFEARAQRDFRRSLRHSKAALKRLDPRNSRYSDALFAVALSLSNLKRPYEALALYSRARQRPSTSPYRRLLCTMNEGYERLAISDVIGIRLLLPELPWSRAARLSTALELLENHSPSFSTALLDDPSIPFSERDQLWMYIAENALLKKPVDWQSLEHVKEFLEKRKQTDRSAFTRIAGYLLGIRTLNDAKAAWLEFDDVAIERKMSFKDFADLCYLRILVGLALGRDMSAHYRKLSAKLDSEGIRDPLIPTIERLLRPEFALHQRLAVALGLLDSSRSSFALNPRSMTLSHAGVSWNLRKSPRTMQLLTAFAEESGPLEKSQIHRALGGGRYVPHLHDPRIWMLITRIRKQFLELWSLDPFHLPGNNLVCLAIELTVSEDA